MKQFLIYIFLPVFCFSQNRYTINDIVTPTKEKITYLKSTMEPLNGMIYNDQGDVGLYIDGQKTGVHKSWYKSGQLRYVFNYKKNQFNGEQKGWYENGKLK